MRLKSLVGVLAITGLIVAGCGGGDDSGSGSGGSGGGGEAAAPAGLKAGDTIKVGYAASKTGLLSSVEQDLGKFIDAYVEDVNAKGGIDGKVKIELETIDCGSDPAKCSNVTQQLLDNGAKFIIGPCDVDVALPAALLTTKADTAMLTTCAGGASFREQAGKSAFLNTHSAPVLGHAQGEFAAKEGHKTAAIMTSADLQYTDAVGKGAQERFEAKGGKVLKVETAKLGQPQYTSQANAIANANPDVVMASLFLPSSNTFIQNLRSAGYKGPVYGVDGTADAATLAIGSAAENVYPFGYAHLGDDTLPSVKSAIDIYTKKYGKPPTGGLGVLGADVILLLEAAVKKAGTVEDSAAILDALENLENVEAASGPITYKGRNGIPKKDVVVLKTDVPNKGFEQVERFYPEP
jgi:branched-chain amino acid transport system substrate-binding protein